MSHDTLLKAILQAAVEKEDRRYLSCQEAFRLAEEFKVAPAEIGKICNKEKIKLAKCQLGCF